MATYDQARTAVYTEAVAIIKASEHLQAGTRAHILRDVAVAVRYAAGGPQPGGFSEK